MRGNLINREETCRESSIDARTFYRDIRLSKLRELMGAPDGLSFVYMNMPLLKCPAYTNLQTRWHSGERHLHNEVLELLRTGTVCGFGGVKPS